MPHADTQNVTITLPKDVLIQAKHLAVDRGVPLSHLIADLVREKVVSSERYQKAMRRSLAHMNGGLKFELGPITWTREDLHRRH